MFTQIDVTTLRPDFMFVVVQGLSRRRDVPTFAESRGFDWNVLQAVQGEPDSVFNGPTHKEFRQ